MKINQNTKQSHVAYTKGGNIHASKSRIIFNFLYLPCTGVLIPWRCNGKVVNATSLNSEKYGTRPRLLPPGATQCLLLMCDRVSEQEAASSIRKVIVLIRFFFFGFGACFSKVPKSQLSNCNTLVLNSWSLNMLLMKEKPRGPEVWWLRTLTLRRYNGNCSTRNRPEKFRDFWKTGPWPEPSSTTCTFDSY